MTNKDIVWFIERDHDKKKFLIPEFTAENITNKEFTTAENILHKMGVGRAKDNAIVTNDNSAALYHFIVYAQNGKCYLKDLGFGTVVGDKLIIGVGSVIQVNNQDRIVIYTEDKPSASYLIKSYEPTPVDGEKTK
jgi:hypothetical protein